MYYCEYISRVKILGNVIIPVCPDEFQYILFLHIILVTKKCDKRKKVIPFFLWFQLHMMQEILDNIFLPHLDLVRLGASQLKSCVECITQ